MQFGIVLLVLLHQQAIGNTLVPTLQTIESNQMTAFSTELNPSLIIVIIITSLHVFLHLSPVIPRLQQRIVKKLVFWTVQGLLLCSTKKRELPSKQSTTIALLIQRRSLTQRWIAFSRKALDLGIPKLRSRVLVLSITVTLGEC